MAQDATTIDITISRRIVISNDVVYYTNKQRRVLMHAELSPTDLILTPSKENFKRLSLRLVDVLGAEREKQSVRVFSCPKGKKKRRSISSLVFELETEQLATEWVHIVQYLASPFTSDVPTLPEMCERPPKTRTYLVLLNPVGGSGRAVKVYQKHVAPVFKHSNITTEEIITSRSDHAMEYVRDHSDLTNFDCIVAVGGDGFLSEVIQGLMRRLDWEQAIQTPIGVIPAGSGNGLVHSIAAAAEEYCDPLGAAFMIAKGVPKGLDIATVRSSCETFYSFLSFEWALIANIDIESEKLRCLGPARFTASAIARLCNSRRWTGRFSYLPASNSTPEEYFGVKRQASTTAGPAVRLLSEVGQPVPENWETIEGEFGIFWAVSCSHAASDALVYPNAQLDDGYIYVMYAEGHLSFKNKLSVLLSLENGSYLSHPQIHVVRTRAFEIQGVEETDIMAVDGELWGTETTQVQVHRKMGQIMCLED